MQELYVRVECFDIDNMGEAYIEIKCPICKGASKFFT